MREELSEEAYLALEVAVLQLLQLQIGNWKS